MKLPFTTLEWIGPATTGHLRLIDQTKLPNESTYIDCKTVQEVWDAIKRLSVRGAPAIGIAAAYGCVIGAQQSLAAFEQNADHLATSRPTAVNLFWAIDQMKKVEPRTPENLLAHAVQIHNDDRDMCNAIGNHGFKIIEQLAATANASTDPSNHSGIGILTHCNAGALATGGIGTATAPMYVAHQHDLKFNVFADETRPLLQGSRLTAYELAAAGIDVTIICDDMAAQVMRENRISMIITGADRIAANGDAANKIGTYNLAVLANYHNIPFYIAAPSSTFDMNIPDGSHIPIEQRGSDEITQGFGSRTAPPDELGAKTYCPAFDVTPAELITAIITERGLINPVTPAQVLATLNNLRFTPPA